MKASEAREKTERTRAEMRDILNSIERATDRGEDHISFFHLWPSQQENLKKNGYKIEFISDSAFWNISW